jgi:hypothetical protein
MSLMKWVKVSDGLPNGPFEILIRYDEEVSLGHYDRKQDVFILRNGTKISYKGKKVYWMELVRPEHGV